MGFNYFIGQTYAPVSYEGFENAIVIIGYSNKGPSMIPVYISDVDKVTTIFGDEGELPQACIEAMNANATHIIAFRINGIYPAATLYNTTHDFLLKFYAVSAGEDLNEMKIVVDSGNECVIIQVYGVNNQLQKEYIVSKESTISSLVDMINYDALFGFVSVIAECPKDFTHCEELEITGPDGRSLRGGESEEFLDDVTLYDRLSFIYSILETISFDIILPLPVKYLQHTSVNVSYSKKPKVRMFYNQLGDFCNIKKNSGCPVVGIISANDMTQETTKEYIEYLKEKVVQYSNGEGGYVLRRTSHVIVLKAWLTGSSSYVSNGAGSLAGLLNSLKRNISPANKSIDESLGLEKEFDEEEIETLSELGICTFKETLRKGVVLAKAVTSSNDDSSFSIRDERLSNYIHTTITAYLDQYIGEASFNQHGNINTTVDLILSQMQEENMIYDYQYNVLVNQNGFANILVEVIPYGEVKSVSTAILTQV